jgi:hypothetical protein
MFKKNLLLAYLRPKFSILKMEAKTVPIYKTTPRHKPEDCNFKYFVVPSIAKCNFNYEKNEDEMGWSCSTNGG